MDRECYRYVISESVDFDEAEQTLHLAITAVEGMHGEARVRLGVRMALNSEARAIVIDADTEVGQRVNEIFTSYMQREFGPDAFAVVRGKAPAAGM